MGSSGPHTVSFGTAIGGPLQGLSAEDARVQQLNQEANATRFVRALPSQWVQQQSITVNGVQIEIGPYGLGVAYAIITCDDPNAIHVTESHDGRALHAFLIGDDFDGYLLSMNTVYRMAYKDELVCTVCPLPPSVIENDDIATFEVPIKLAQWSRGDGRSVKHNDLGRRGQQIWGYSRSDLPHIDIGREMAERYEAGEDVARNHRHETALEDANRRGMNVYVASDTQGQGDPFSFGVNTLAIPYLRDEKDIDDKYLQMLNKMIIDGSDSTVGEPIDITWFDGEDNGEYLQPVGSASGVASTSTSSKGSK